MILLNGKAVAAAVRAEISASAEKIYQSTGKRAGLAVLLVGNNPASEVYVNNKIKACKEAGITSFSYRLPSDAKEEEAAAILKECADNPEIHGILVQLPLPSGFCTEKLLSLIPVEKDVDGFGKANIGSLALCRPEIVSCTPKGVMELLRRYEIPVAGKHAVVLGRSNIVGRPMALLLLNADATVTICHSKTKELEKITRQADILVAAIGKPNFVTGDMVKEGATVIDVGMNRLDGKLVGDVEFESVKEKAAYLTPVPGGVGPMTIAMLLQNTFEAFLRAEGFGKEAK